METSKNIAATELQSNLKLIVEERNKCTERLHELDEDEKAIHRILKRMGINVASLSIQKAELAIASPKPADPTRGRKRDIVVDFLREKGIAMKSIEIRQALRNEKGVEINQNTFDAIMSNLQAQYPQSKVKKVAFRTYQYAA